MIKKYSPFIRKNFKEIQDLNFRIYPTGNAIYKSIDRFDILITDYSIYTPFIITNIIHIELWIKPLDSEEIVFKKNYSGSIFIPRLEKIYVDICKYILREC